MNTPLTKTELNKAIEEINETAATKLRAMEKAENTMKHKHAELIKAWADGAEIEAKWKNADCDWYVQENFLWLISSEFADSADFRIKPEEKKPDIVQERCIAHWTKLSTNCCCNIRVTFDGETGKLKSAEIL